MLSQGGACFVGHAPTTCPAVRSEKHAGREFDTGTHRGAERLMSSWQSKARRELKRRRSRLSTWGYRSAHAASVEPTVMACLALIASGDEQTSPGRREWYRGSPMANDPSAARRLGSRLESNGFFGRVADSLRSAFMECAGWLRDRDVTCSKLAARSQGRGDSD